VGKKTGLSSYPHAPSFGAHLSVRACDCGFGDDSGLSD
jgi:hypothetical protein